MTNRDSVLHLAPGLRTGAILLFTALTASAFAEERGLEQRLADLEHRIQQLEAELASSAKPVPAMASRSVIGRFDEPHSAAKRWIEFKNDGTFVLQTLAEKFVGTWKQSGATVSIRVPAGLDAQFRWDGERLVDSQGVAWLRAEGR